MIRYPLTYNPILEYNAAIENGQVVVSKKVATVYRKLAQDVVNGCGDYAYKAKRANHAIEFIENYCCRKGEGHHFRYRQRAVPWHHQGQPRAHQERCRSFP